MAENTTPKIGDSIPADFVKKHTPASERELDRLVKVVAARRERGKGFAK